MSRHVNNVVLPCKCGRLFATTCKIYYGHPGSQDPHEAPLSTLCPGCEATVRAQLSERRASAARQRAGAAWASLDARQAELREKRAQQTAARATGSFYRPES